MLRQRLQQTLRVQRRRVTSQIIKLRTARTVYHLYVTNCEDVGVHPILRFRHRPQTTAQSTGVRSRKCTNAVMVGREGEKGGSTTAARSGDEVRSPLVSKPGNRVQLSAATWHPIDLFPLSSTICSLVALDRCDSEGPSGRPRHYVSDILPSPHWPIRLLPSSASTTSDILTSRH